MSLKYGSFTRLVNLVHRLSGFDVTVQPSSASADTVFQYPAAGGGTKAIVTADSTATLTNKTIDAVGQITNIANANINSGAAIAFSKLASLATGHILAGNAGVATDVTVSGDVTIGATGDVQIAAGVIVNADVNASAAIAVSKLAALTASRAVASDGSGFVSASAVTSTELGYLSGVTSAIQTQLNNISTTVDGLSWKLYARAATTVNGALATAFENGDVIDGVTLATGDRILIKNQTAPEENGIYVVAASGAPARSSDANTWAELVSAAVMVSEGSANADKKYVCTVDAGGTIGVTAVTFVNFAAGVAYLADGTTLTLTGSTFSISSGGVSNAQVNASAAIAYSKLAALTASRALVSDGSGFVSAATTTSTEIGYVNGVTSAIQTQLDGMAQLVGRSGGQNLRGDTASAGSLLLGSTFHATKGLVKVNDGSGFVSYGNAGTNDPSAFFIANATLFGVGTDDVTTSGLPHAVVYSQGTVTSGVGTAAGPEIDFRSSRDTFAAPAFLLTNDRLASLYFCEYNGTTNGNKVAAAMQVISTETHSTSAYGNVIRFSTIANAATARTTRLDIAATGVKVSNCNLITDTDNTRDFGSTSVFWANGYINKLLMKSNSQTTSIQGSALATASIAYKMPVDAGTNGYVLATDGTVGVLSWVSNTGSSTSFAATIAAAATSPQTITHSLASLDVIVQIVEIATGETIDVNTVVREANTNDVTLTFSEAVPTGGWRVLVQKV